MGSPHVPTYALRRVRPLITSSKQFHNIYIYYIHICAYAPTRILRIGFDVAVSPLGFVYRNLYYRYVHKITRVFLVLIRRARRRPGIKYPAFFVLFFSRKICKTIKNVNSRLTARVDAEFPILHPETKYNVLRVRRIIYVQTIGLNPFSDLTHACDRSPAQRY